MDFQPHKHHQPHCRHTTCSADRQTDHIPVIWTHHGIIVAPWWTQCHFILVTWKIPIVPLGTKLSNYSILIKGPALFSCIHLLHILLLHHHGTLGLSSWKLLDTIWRPKQSLDWKTLACTIAWQHLHWYLSSLHQHNRVIHGFESRMRIYWKNRYLITSNIDYLFTHTSSTSHIITLLYNLYSFKLLLHLLYMFSHMVHLCTYIYIYISPSHSFPRTISLELILKKALDKV